MRSIDEALMLADRRTAGAWFDIPEMLRNGETMLRYMERAAKRGAIDALHGNGRRLPAASE
jgi:hypothetical protein